MAIQPDDLQSAEDSGWLAGDEDELLAYLRTLEDNDWDRSLRARANPIPMNLTV